MMQNRKGSRNLYWHQLSRTASQALSKEFSASAPRVIQRENPPVQWPQRLFAPSRIRTLDHGGGNIPQRPRPLPLEPTPRGFLNKFCNPLEGNFHSSPSARVVLKCFQEFRGPLKASLYHLNRN